jgi:hypothetical protein
LSYQNYQERAMRYLMICVLCLVVGSVVFGQEGAPQNSKDSKTPAAPNQESTPKKPAPKLSMDDFTSPVRPSSSASIPRASSSADVKLEYTEESYKLRKALIKYSEDVSQRPRELVNFFLTEQSKGRSGDYCFCDKRLASSLFAVRGWTIVDSIQIGKGMNFKVRIDSSNKGGTPITVVWSMSTKESSYGNGDMCIGLMTSSQGL